MDKKKSSFDLYDQAIVKAMKKMDIPLTSRRIATTTRMHQKTAKAHLDKLSKDRKVKSITFGKRKKFKLL